MVSMSSTHSVVLMAHGGEWVTVFGHTPPMICSSQMESLTHSVHVIDASVVLMAHGGEWFNSDRAHSSDVKASHRTGRSAPPLRGESFTSPRQYVSRVSSALRTTWLTTSLHPMLTMANESTGEDAVGAAGCRLCAFRRGRMVPAVWGLSFVKGVRGVRDSLAPSVVAVARRCCLLLFQVCRCPCCIR